MKESSNALLQAEGGEGYRGVVGGQDRADRTCHLSEVWGGRTDTGRHRVSV